MEFTVQKAARAPSGVFRIKTGPGCPLGRWTAKSAFCGVASYSSVPCRRLPYGSSGSDSETEKHFQLVFLTSRLSLAFFLPASTCSLFVRHHKDNRGELPSKHDQAAGPAFGLGVRPLPGSRRPVSDCLVGVHSSFLLTWALGGSSVSCSSGAPAIHMEGLE